MESGRSLRGGVPPTLMVVALLLLHSPRVQAGGVGVSVAAHAPVDSVTIEAAADTTKAFHLYVVPSQRSPRANRDLEFLWSDTYSQVNKPLDPGTGQENDLDRLGVTLCNTESNPFGFGVPDIQLIHDYLNTAGRTYNASPDSVIGLLVGPPNYPVADRKHVDTYIYYPGGGALGDNPNLHDRGRWPSDFTTADEDLTTGKPSAATALVRNSISVPGPDSSQVGLPDTVSWTRPDEQGNFGFNHEFHHALNNGGPSDGPLTEIFSSAAEAIGGERPAAPQFDVPYTWSLIEIGGNYQAWRSFSAYLVYNFRGVDTTYAGRSDDLMWRWARNPGALAALGAQLTDGTCAECAAKPYFEDLTDIERLQVLIHNWRVGNYANAYFLADSQFGFNPFFGFDPNRDVGNWRDVDGIASDDSISVPPVIELDAEDKTSETIWTERPGTVNFDARPLRLGMFGAEYFVVRKAAGLTGSQDLVVRVDTDSILRRHVDRINADELRTAELRVSLVGYRQDDDSLYAHPELIRSVQSAAVEADSLRGELEFVVPDFGDSTHAVVVVATLGDGPEGVFSSASQLSHAVYENGLDIRLSVALRASPYQSVNPLDVAADTTALDEHPSWAPADSNAIVFQRSAGDSTRLFRKSLSGGEAAQLIANGLNQSYPDWSPRGDCIAFTQENPTPSGLDIYVLELAASTARRLTNNGGSEMCAVFQPNGQGLAYCQVVDPEEGPSQLRKIGLDGEGDIVLVSRGGTAGIRSPRWAPDGEKVYFVVNDSLYSVASGGGVVTIESAVLPAASSLDLPRGTGPVVAEVPETILWESECLDPLSGCTLFEVSQIQMPVRYVALRDTATGQQWKRFYHTGATFYDPRWSPDGTKIAYSSDVNKGGDRDVFVGQVSFNHAPGFTGSLSDVVADTCGKIVIDLAASDPDDETVTFGVAHKPPTATFDTGTGVFEWDPPTSGDHYVVFRALDGSGGVAERVVRISVPDSIRPDSLTIGEALVSSNTAWIEWYAVGDDSLISTACTYDIRRNSSPLTEGNWTSSPGVSGTVPSPASSGTYQQMQITGLSPNTTYYFAAKVRDEARDHWSKLSNVIQVHTTSGGGGLSARQTGPGEASARGATAMSLDLDRKAEAAALIGSSHALAAELIRSGEGLSWLVYHLGEEETSTITSEASGAQVVTQSRSGSEWTSLGSVSLASQDTTLSVHCRLADGTRLVFLGDHRLVLASAGAHGLAIQSADHNRLGSLLEELAPASGEFELNSGDSLRMVYAPTEEQISPTAGFLTLRRIGTGSTPTSRLPQRPQLPQAFALAQNHPNPFASVTTIRFDLPRPEQVRLEIFDAQGRRVARLADGWYPAGFHAVEWDRRGEGGRWQPGVYLYRIEAGSFRDQKKLVLLP